MKIAIVSDDEKTICSHFGKTRGFVIFDVEGNNIKSKEYRLNTFTAHALGLEDSGHGYDKHSAIINALSDCKVVISNGMGRRIYDDLNQAGIEAFITEETDVQKALDLYIKNELINKPELSCSHQH